MAIPFTCSCGHAYSLNDSLAGQRRKCMHCGEIMNIPGAAVPSPAVEIAPAKPMSARTGFYQPQMRPPIPANATPEELAERAAAVRASYGAPPLIARPILPERRPEWSKRYWLLMLALIPLVMSSFKKDDFDFEKQFEASIQGLSDDAQKKIAAVAQKFENGEGEVKDIVDALPAHKLNGALLPVYSRAHWLFALLCATVFLLVIGLFFPSNKATVLGLIAVGAFTGTIGILLLLGVQWAATNISVFPRGGGKLAIILMILWLIGLSYTMAESRDYNFWLSLLGFTFGVGLCEELCKALPVYHHFVSYGQKMDWRGACAWGLASGVGFGVSEAIMYASDYNGILGGEIYLIRFISCVALHAIWAASSGLNIWKHRMDLDHRDHSGWERFFLLVKVTFIPMLLHGLYDTLLKKEMPFIAMLSALASFAYFAWKIEDAKSTERVLEPNVVTA